MYWSRLECLGPGDVLGRPWSTTVGHWGFNNLQPHLVCLRQQTGPIHTNHDITLHYYQIFINSEENIYEMKIYQDGARLTRYLHWTVCFKYLRITSIVNKSLPFNLVLLLPIRYPFLIT